MKSSKGRQVVATSALLAVVLLITAQRNNAQHRQMPFQYRRLHDGLALLPEILENNLGTVGDPLNVTDTAIFLHIPKAGGTSMKNLYGECYGMVLATGGAGRGHEHDDKLMILPEYDRKFVNVETEDCEGIENAKKLHFAESGMVDVIFTMQFASVVSLFSKDYQARFFTIFRHPIERAVSQFYYLQDATWETTYSPETKGWSVQQYAESHYASDNWVVRQLVNKLDSQAELYDEDIELAKDILREKFVVGLITKMEESKDRFDKYFGFGFDENEETDACVARVLGLPSARKDETQTTNSHPHPKVLPNTPEWEALLKINMFDLELYEYAVALFEEQAILFEDSEEDEA